MGTDKAANMVALLINMMMISSKDSTIQTIPQVQTVNSTHYKHHAKYNDYDYEIKW